jgi:hypothetical protein
LPWGKSWPDIFKDLRSASWIIGTIISVALSLIIAKIAVETGSWIIPFELLILLIIFCLSVIFFMILQDLNEKYCDYEKYVASITEIVKRTPNEVSQPFYCKTVIFDDQTFEELQNLKGKSYEDVKKDHDNLPSVFVRAHREIKNNMEYYKYGNFREELSSFSFVPELRNMNALFDNEQVDLNEKNSVPIIFISYELNDTKLLNPKKSTLHFTIPFSISPGMTKPLEINYRTKAFDKAIWHRTDWIALKVTRPTDTFRFEIVLKGKMQENYMLMNSCDVDDESKGVKKISVTDTSGQRILPYENEIWEQCCPIWSQNSISWEIRNPKLGYNYSLFFTLGELEKI